MTTRRTALFTALFAWLLGMVPIGLQAAWELPSLISAGMVLQQDENAPLWGWDEPGTTVTLTFRGTTVTALAGEDGKWRAKVPTGKAGGPFKLEIRGTKTVAIEDVLVGEVWLAGGQSNMWWHEGSCTQAEQEKLNADYAAIRIWDANTSPSQGGWPAQAPQRTVPASWKASSAVTVAGFPGVPFFFARELHRKLGVPVGIVHLAVPGQAIETFLSPAYLETNWPNYPVNSNAPPPCCFFNGMVAPTAPYAIRGFLWWQGESNASHYPRYRVLFPALIEDWRRCWERPAAPFLFVELANFLKLQSRPVEDDTWPALRDAQAAALALDKVWEVTAVDVLSPAENPSNIHPPNKQLIGHRLFAAAMANVYGARRMVWSGPRYRAVRFEGPQAVVSFDHIEGGLAARDGNELRGFAVAGQDREFHWAEARISHGAVVVTSTNVAAPVSVRYGWANNPQGNLVNAAGLPAFPFRTDHWNLGAH